MANSGKSPYAMGSSSRDIVCPESQAGHLPGLLNDSRVANQSSSNRHLESVQEERSANYRSASLLHKIIIGISPWLGIHCDNCRDQRVPSRASNLNFFAIAAINMTPSTLARANAVPGDPKHDARTIIRSNAHAIECVYTCYTYAPDMNNKVVRTRPLLVLTLAQSSQQD